MRPSFRDMLFIVCILFVVHVPPVDSSESSRAVDNLQGGETMLLYFYSPGCGDCSRVSKMLGKFKESDPDLKVIQLNILKSDVASLNKGLCLQYDIPENKHVLAPSIFGATDAIVTPDITPHALMELVESSRGKVPPWADAAMLKEAGNAAIRENYRNLTPLMIVGAGLADGINPCAFAVIIFFLTYMTFVGRGKREIVLAGLLYTVAVFVTYLAIGIGLYELISADILASLWLRQSIYGVLIVLLGGASALSFRDALACRRGDTEKVSLKLPSFIKHRIRLYITRRTRRGLTIVGALSLGAIVSLLEFPCTGQTYIPIVTYLSVNPLNALGWLVIYNLCFILPLIIIFVGILCGTSSDQIKGMFQRHVAKAKFTMSAMFALMAVILLLTFP